MVEKNALRLLSIKSRSTEELRKKLISRGFSPQEIEPVLVKMVSLGFLNDQEMAERRFKNLLEKGYGPRYVVLKMKEQGLKMPSYPASLQEEAARAVLKTAAFRRKDVRKKGAALQRRGFDLEVIYAVLGAEC